MVVMAVLSGERFGADHTSTWVLPLLQYAFPTANPSLLTGLHAAFRKMAHVMDYAVLALLWLRVLGAEGPRRRAGLWAVGLTAVYAVADEARQGLTPNRTPSARDVGLDTLGAILAVAAIDQLGAGEGPLMRLVQGLVLIFGMATLTVALWDVALGLPAWDLGLAALGAAIAGWGLRAADPLSPSRAAAATADGGPG
jgi:VanZ family protein